MQSSRFREGWDEADAFVLWQKWEPSIPAWMGQNVPRVAWMMDAVYRWSLWAVFPTYRTGPGSGTGTHLHPWVPLLGEHAQRRAAQEGGFPSARSPP